MAYRPGNANGQTTSANSAPVVLASDQPALPLSTGAATDATLAAMSAKLPTLGQQAASASQPVVSASDQIGIIITGQAAQINTINNILTPVAGSAAQDASRYRSFVCQIVSTGTGGTYLFEGSVDNVNFNPITVFSLSNQMLLPINTAITATASAIQYAGACPQPYMRLRIVTAITGGSVQAIIFFSQNPLSVSQTVVGQGTAGNLNANIGTLSTLSQFLASSAAGDGTANPTTTGIRDFPHLFNGATWDRDHGNWNTTTGDTGAKVASGNGATQTNYDSIGGTITVLLGTVSGTFTTFQFQLQYSPDSGTTWINLGAPTTNDTSPVSTNAYVIKIFPGINTSGTTGAKQTTMISDTLPRTWRLTWVIAGATPSATITAVYVNYQD